MLRVPLIMSTVAAVVAGSVSAQPVAGPQRGEWTGSIAAGADVTVDGDFHGAANVSLSDLGVLDASLSGLGGALSIESRSFDDIYDTGYGVDLEAAYGLSTKDEIFVSIRYSNVEADGVEIGAASIPALNGDFSVFGEFDDYSAVSAELGYRRFFRDGHRFRPYLTGRAGIAFVDSIDVSLAVPDADIALDDIRFYDSTATFSVGAGPGFVYQVTEKLGIGLESTIRYTGELDGDDADLRALGLDGLNDDGARVSAAGQLRTRYSF